MSGQEQTGPDAIWAPWRLDYLERLGEAERVQVVKDAGGPRGAGGTANPTKRDGVCFLRAAWLDPSGDESGQVIVRGAHGLILLNKYPYANGHLLVCLGEGRARLMDYPVQDRRRLWALVDAAVDLVEVSLEPQGVNVGVNQGRAAGAGVPDHLHAHVVPRWGGDVNFITVVGQVRVVPSSLEAMARRMRAAWAGIEGKWREILEA